MKLFPVSAVTRLLLGLIISASVCSRFLAAEETQPGKKPVIGWAERARIYPGAVLVDAKVSAGDRGSAIHAANVVPFEKDGERWVRFVLRDLAGKAQTMERKVIRRARGRQNPKKASYIVGLGTCIAGVYQDAEVRLSDRSSRAQRAVFGRNLLAGNFIIDPSYSFTHEPECGQVR